MLVAPAETLMIIDQAGKRTAGKRTAKSSRLISRADGQSRASMQAREMVIKQHMDMMNINNKLFEPMTQAAMVSNKQDSNVS